MMIVRPPIVAGQFYDVDPVRLRKQIQSAMSLAGDAAESKRKIRAAVVPHAGYAYSGWVAAHFYSMLGRDSPKRSIIIGPNHSLAGSHYATMRKGLWKTPLGSVMVDEVVADALLKGCELIEQDVIPHQYDHSIEVQLPFLQYVVGSELKFVPLAIKSEAVDSTLLDGCRAVGKAIAGVVKGSKDKLGVISTSDFSHYVPQKLAEDVDGQVIKQIVKLNEKAFFDSVNERNASMCGAGAVATAIVAAKALGAKSGKLLKYATSADTSGDASAVVGYASIIM